MSDTESIWFYARSGQQFGPVSTDSIRDLLTRGELRPADLVWRNGMPQWQPVSSLPEFTAAQPQPQPQYAPPPPPPPPSPIGYGTHSYSTPPSPAKGRAVAAFVCSLVGLLGFFCLGVILGIIAVVLSRSAQRDMETSKNFDGHGLATAAFIIGIIDILGGLGSCGFHTTHFSHFRHF